MQKAEHSGFLFTVVINAVVAVWAAPAVSASISRKTRIHFALGIGTNIGAYRSVYIIRVASVCIIAGASIHYGMDTRNVLCAALGQSVLHSLRCW